MELFVFQEKKQMKGRPIASYDFDSTVHVVLVQLTLPHHISQQDGLP